MNEISDTRYLESGGYIAVLREPASAESDFFSRGWGVDSVGAWQIFWLFALAVPPVPS